MKFYTVGELLKFKKNIIFFSNFYNISIFLFGFTNYVLKILRKKYTEEENNEFIKIIIKFFL